MKRLFVGCFIIACLGVAAQKSEMTDTYTLSVKEAVSKVAASEGGDSVSVNCFIATETYVLFNNGEKYKLVRKHRFFPTANKKYWKQYVLEDSWIGEVSGKSHIIHYGPQRVKGKKSAIQKQILSEIKSKKEVKVIVEEYDYLRLVYANAKTAEREVKEE